MSDVTSRVEGSSQLLINLLPSKKSSYFVLSHILVFVLSLTVNRQRGRHTTRRVPRIQATPGVRQAHQPVRLAASLRGRTEARGGRRAEASRCDRTVSHNVHSHTKSCLTVI